MHPLVYLIPVIGIGVGLAVAVSIALARERDRERVYYSAFERDTSAVGVDLGLLQQLLADVERRIRGIRDMPPGSARSREIRKLRADFHPDRHVHLPMLQATFMEVTSIINDRTDELLDQA